MDVVTLGQARAQGDRRWSKGAALRRMGGVRQSGMIPVADHTHANPANILATYTLGAVVSTAPAFGTSETWTLTSIASLPATGQQVVGLIEGEVVLITAYGTTSVTVIRGINGYVATHASGVQMYVANNADALTADGGRVARRRHHVTVDGGTSSLAPHYDNFSVQILGALYGEVGGHNAVAVRAMVELLCPPMLYGKNAWTTSGSYSAGQVISDAGTAYIYTAASSVGTHPASDGNATSLGDARHTTGSSWDSAWTYSTNNVVFWRGAYWKAASGTTGDEPRITSTKWTIIVPTGVSTAWVSGTNYTAGQVVRSTYPGSTQTVLYMCLGLPGTTGANTQSPASSPMWWGMLATHPVEFQGQDAARTVTIPGGGSATAKPVIDDLAQGAYFFLTTWAAPVSNANGTTATAGAAGHYPLSGHPLLPGIDSVACTIPNQLNPGGPTNYCAWGDYALNGVVPQPAVWSSATTYAVGEVVNTSGYFWRSIQATNLNKNPSSQPLWWERIYSSFEPTTVLGTPAKGAGRVVSIAVPGDSIVDGTGDTLNYASDGINATEKGGWFCRGVNNRFSWQRIARSGDQLRNRSGQRGLRRRAMASGATHVLGELSVNDMSAGVSFEEMKDRLTSEAERYVAAGMAVAWTTCTPVTTSTDAWATTANQTTSVGHKGDTSAAVAVSEVAKFNAWLRTVPSPLSAVVDVARSVETYDPAANGGTGGWVWKLTAGAASTTDGTHPTTAAHAVIAADATTYATGLYGFTAWLAALTAPIP